MMIIVGVNPLLTLYGNLGDTGGSEDETKEEKRRKKQHWVVERSCLGGLQQWLLFGKVFSFCHSIFFLVSFLCSHLFTFFIAYVNAKRSTSKMKGNQGSFGLWILLVVSDTWSLK